MNPDSGERLIFLLNYSAAIQTITSHKDVTDALTGAQLRGSIPIEPFGVRIREMPLSPVRILELIEEGRAQRA